MSVAGEDKSTYSREFGADDARAIRSAIKQEFGPELMRSPVRRYWPTKCCTERLA